MTKAAEVVFAILLLEVTVMLWRIDDRLAEIRDRMHVVSSFEEWRTKK